MFRSLSVQTKAPTRIRPSVILILIKRFNHPSRVLRDWDSSDIEEFCVEIVVDSVADAVSEFSLDMTSLTGSLPEFCSCCYVTTTEIKTNKMEYNKYDGMYTINCDSNIINVLLIDLVQ